MTRSGANLVNMVSCFIAGRGENRGVVYSLALRTSLWYLSADRSNEISSVIIFGWKYRRGGRRTYCLANKDAARGELVPMAIVQCGAVEINRDN
jgi:hypothetical protein